MVTLFDASEDDMAGGVLTPTRPLLPTDDVVVAPEPEVVLQDGEAAEGADAPR